MEAVRLTITGRVQGVFFRANAKQLADQLSIRGWARNVQDGSVEIHAEGQGEPLRKFVAWCKEGPPAARVDQMLMTAEKSKGYEEFEIKS